MLDIQFIKTHTDELRENMISRNCDTSILDRLLEIENERSAMQKKMEEVARKRNENAAILQRTKDKTSEEAAGYIALGKALKQELQTLELAYGPINTAFTELMYKMPNITDPTMPRGLSSTDNVEIRQVGGRPALPFPPRDHVAIGKMLDVIDVERSAKVSGSRFGFLKGGAALLEFALQTHLTRKLLGKGFTPLLPPHTRSGTGNVWDRILSYGKIAGLCNSPGKC